MNPSTTALTLNLQLPNIATVSWAVQGDTLSRQITATLVDGSTAWNPQAGYLGVIRFFKPDGTNGVYDTDEGGNPAVTWSGNVATVKIAQQCLAVPGTVLMSLEFYDTNDARISAFGWAMNVQPSAVTDDEFLSSDYYNILAKQIAAVIGAETHPPYIDSTTKDWMVWDADVGDYVDSGVYSIGPPPTPISTTYEYANSGSGTTVPTSWSPTKPVPVQGDYSWTKITTTWDTGTTVQYTAAYQGMDGTNATDLKTMIAAEELTATSAHAYDIGDYFIYNSTLYVATAAISVSDTITPGTNCQQAVLGGDLSTLKRSVTHAEEGLAYIVGNTNTTGIQLTEGMFVYVKGHSSITEGLRKVNSNGPIAVSGSVTATNTDAVGNGGLNDLKNTILKWKYLGGLNGAIAKSFSVANSSRIALFTFSGNTNVVDILILRASGTGAISAFKIRNASGITFSGSTNQFSITSSDDCNLEAIIFYGDIS